MQFNCKMGYSGNEQDYQLIKTSLSELKKYSNQKEVLRYLTNVLPNPTDIVTLDNAQNTVKSVKAQLANKNLLSEMSLYPTITNNAVPIHFKAGQKYTISFTTTYTAWRLMFFGTDKNGTAFDASNPNTSKYISEMYTGATGRLQHAINRSGNTFTFTCNEDCIITAIVFWNASNETDKTYSDFQLELGTTATAYTPYISDFSTVKVSRCGKNLFDNSIPYSDYLSYSGGYAYLSIYVGKGSTITVSLPQKYNSGLGGYFYCRPSNGNRTDTSQEWLYHNSINALCQKSVTIVSQDGFVSLFMTIDAYDDFKDEIMVEIGSTATDYELYQGQTYTPTATGEVKGITVLTPTTNIINNKGLLFTKVVGDDFNYIN